MIRTKGRGTITGTWKKIDLTRRVEEEAYKMTVKVEYTEMETHLKVLVEGGSQSKRRKV